MSVSFPCTIADLPTPCLLLSEPALRRNAERFRQIASGLNVPLRAHGKTIKSARVLEAAGFSGAPLTVSTLAEAEHYAAHGHRDLLYAIGFTPDKLPRVLALRAQGADVAVSIDHAAAAQSLAQAMPQDGPPLRVFIEIDGGAGRMGLEAQSPDLPRVAAAITQAPALQLAGIYSYPGGLYCIGSAEEHARTIAERRQQVVEAAHRLQTAGFPVPIASIGGTPLTAWIDDVTGLNELRPGVFFFMDLMQRNIGVCGYEDIAVTVLASVIGHRPATNMFYLNAGALALSKDEGIAPADVPHAPYGKLRHPQDPRPWDGLGVLKVNQEHGYAGATDGEAVPYTDLPIGTRVRIFPNHVCHTVFGHAGYYVLDADERVIDFWPRADGW